MSDDNLFGSVNLDDLANSEGAIIEGAKPSKEITIDINNGKEEKEEKIEVNKNSVDVDEIANYGDESEEETEESSLKKTKTPVSNEKNTTPSSQSALTSLATVLHEAGVFSNLAKEDLYKITDVDGLVKTISEQIKSNELSDLDDNQKEYIKAIRDGVSHTTFLERKSNAEQYKNLTDDVIEKAPQIGFELIKRSLIVQGIDEERAIKLANKAINDEDGLEEALTSRDYLIKYEEDQLKKEIEAKAKEKENKIKESLNKIETLKSKINENTEILSGIKVNSQTKEKIFSSMTTPVNAKGETLLNEVMDLYGKDDDYKLKVHALHILTKGFTDFSKFKTTAKSNALLELEEKLATGKTPMGNLGNKHNSNLGGGSTSRQIVDALPNFGFGKK